MPHTKNTVPLSSIVGGFAALHVTVFNSGSSEKDYLFIRVSVDGSSTDVNSEQLPRKRSLRTGIPSGTTIVLTFNSYSEYSPTASNEEGSTSV